MLHTQPATRFPLRNAQDMQGGALQENVVRRRVRPVAGPQGRLLQRARLSGGHDHRWVLPGTLECWRQLSFLAAGRVCLQRVSMLALWNTQAH